ncbi:nucleotidyltransferase domain-containing protein [Candidatus Babeliales bacterium]|nr:nucleotidyltransferase domain-containing protein [Candidatus Babeliales bacterium]
MLFEKDKIENLKINKDIIIDFLRKHKFLLKEEYGVKEIALFGSFARGEESLKSDIDLLIEMENVSFRNKIKLKRFLEEKFKRRVDIGYLNSVRIFIKKQIEKDLIYA